MANNSPPVDDLTYEQAFSELEELVATLEAEEGTLDEVLAKFERSQALIRHCTTLLDKAELTIKQLVEDEIIDFELDD